MLFISTIINYQARLWVRLCIENVPFWCRRINSLNRSGLTWRGPSASHRCVSFCSSKTVSCEPATVTYVCRERHKQELWKKMSIVLFDGLMLELHVPDVNRKKPCNYFMLLWKSLLDIWPKLQNYSVLKTAVDSLVTVQNSPGEGGCKI